MSKQLPSITSADLKAALSGQTEIAVLDVREHGQYGEGHPFFAVSCPFSELEFRAAHLLPCTRTQVVVFDQSGEGIAARAAVQLAGLGYTDVYILEGGADGWRSAGYEHFKGVNVPSKAFGEIVERVMHTPSVSAQTLHGMISRGENVLVIDGRTSEEFARMNIPTARSCPNAELAYRIGSIVPDPKTPIVINCAGRTRSIIGAQTLISMGLDNPVMALRNGTQGWQLAGFSLEYDSDPGELAMPAAPDTVAARTAHFSTTNGIPRIDIETLRRWQAEVERCLYIFDVRTKAEFQAASLPGATHAPGGQLVQATDHWIATRNARVVLACDLGPRAVTTCYWLRAMGHDAYVLNADVSKSTFPGTNKNVRPQLPQLDSVPHLNAAEFARMRSDDVMLLDASAGTDYRSGHIVGAQWVIRPRLGRHAMKAGQTVVVCGEPQRALLLAHDLLSTGNPNVSVLDGSYNDWVAAGLAIEATPDLPPDNELIDFLFFVHDRHSGSLEAARQYLAWETGLTDKMDMQEHAVFKVNPTVQIVME